MDYFVEYLEANNYLFYQMTDSGDFKKYIGSP